jgi:hypothetical protein
LIGQFAGFNDDFIAPNEGCDCFCHNVVLKPADLEELQSKPVRTRRAFRVLIEISQVSGLVISANVILRPGLVAFPDRRN